MDEQIKNRAYALWEADGRPEGQDKSYWFKAMEEIASLEVKSIKPAAKRKPARSKKAA